MTLKPSKKSKQTNNVSQASIFDLKGLVSEHQSKFQKEGRDAVKGEAGVRRGIIGELVSTVQQRANRTLAQLNRTKRIPARSLKTGSRGHRLI